MVFVKFIFNIKNSKYMCREVERELIIITVQKPCKITFCCLGCRTSVFFYRFQIKLPHWQANIFRLWVKCRFCLSFPPTWFCVALVASHWVIYCDMWQPSLKCDTAIYYVGVSCSVKWSFSFVLSVYTSNLMWSHAFLTTLW